MFERLCGAKARTNSYRPCRQPSMANGRCRLHGGKCTGPKTDAGKKKVMSVNTKHGFYAKAAREERIITSALLRNLREEL